MKTQKQSGLMVANKIKAIAKASGKLDTACHVALVAAYQHGANWGDVRPIGEAVAAMLPHITTNRRKQLVEWLASYSVVTVRPGSKENKVTWKSAEVIGQTDMTWADNKQERLALNMDALESNPFFDIELEAPENTAKLFNAEMLAKRIESLVKDLEKAADAENTRFGFEDEKAERICADTAKSLNAMLTKVKGKGAGNIVPVKGRGKKANA